jgi:hypothetical protein
MFTLLDAEIVDAVLLAAALEADLGAHRKISTFCIPRPLVLAAVIVPLLIEKVSTHGGGLAVQLGNWLAADSIPSAAITDALLAGTAGLVIHSRVVSGGKSTNTTVTSAHPSHRPRCFPGNRCRAPAVRVHQRTPRAVWAQC